MLPRIERRLRRRITGDERMGTWVAAAAWLSTTLARLQT
jgi:hypothetical protein